MNRTALIADIGGTNARFGIVDKDGLHDVVYLQCNRYAGPVEAALEYLKQVSKHRKPESGVFAVAGPITGDLVNFSSSPWSFKSSSVQKDLGFENFEVMNDFEAVARAVPEISPELLQPINDATPLKFKPKSVIGPGTGLGVASLVWTGNRYVPIPGEGGHRTMSAVCQRELDIFQQLRVKYHHISAERVCSGKGLENLYNAIRALDKKFHLPDIDAPDISKKAIEGSCEVCKESLDLMLAFLGRVTGDLALTMMSQGGVYIAGGIPTKLGDYFFKSKFMDEFLHKGRMAELMKSIPVYIIKHDAVGLLALEQHAKLQLG
jgi:glucokinase